MFHLGFPIRTILALFDVQVTLKLPTQIWVSWSFYSGEEVKNRFSRLPHGRHLGFPIGTILAISDLQVTPMFLTKFRVNWPFGSGEEVKNRFSRWRPWRPSWISDRNYFSYFLTYKSPWYFLPCFKSISLSFQEKKWKIDIQDGRHGRHLGFPIGTILAIFYLQVTHMLPTKFRVKWPFSSGEEAKNRCSRWLPWWPCWISDWNNFSYFWFTSHHRCLLPIFESIGLLVQEKKRKIDFSRRLQLWPSWVSDWNDFIYFWSFGPGEEAKNRFSRRWPCGHLGFPIRTILAFFWPTSHADTSYEV